MKIKELKKLSGQKFKRTLLNQEGIEDIPDIKKFALSEALQIGAELQEDANRFFFINPNDKDHIFVFNKPKRNKVVIGELVFRSKDYYFTDPLNGNSYGDMPKSQDIFENGFNLLGFEGRELVKYEKVGIN